MAALLVQMYASLDSQICNYCSAKLTRLEDHP